METEINTDELINKLNDQTSETPGQSAPLFNLPETKEPEGDTTKEPAPGNTQPVTDPPLTPDKAIDMARAWMKRLSSLMKVCFIPLYKKTILKPGDVEKVKNFNNDQQGKPRPDAIHSDHELYPVVNRFERYMKAVDEIPLTPDEIDELAQPLSELIVKYRSLQLSPEWMFAIAVAVIMLPRAAHTMPDFSKLFNK